MSHSTRISLVLAAALAVTLALLARTAPGREDSAPEVGPAKIATLDSLAVIEALLASDRFKPARDAFESQQRAKLDRNRLDMDEIQKKYAALPDASEQRATLAQEFSTKRQAEETMLVEAEKYNTQQVIEAYRVTIDAAGAVAAKLGYSHVLSTRNDPSLIRSENVPGAIQEILARPVLRSPTSDDVTSAVLNELNVKPAPAQTPAAAPTDAPKADAPTPDAPKPDR